MVIHKHLIVLFTSPLCQLKWYKITFIVSRSMAAISSSKSIEYQLYRPFSFMNKLYIPSVLTNKLITQSYTTLYVRFSKYKLGSKSPNILGLKISNKLPTDIRQCSLLKKFKENLKQFLLLKYYYAVFQLVNV